MQHFGRYLRVVQSYSGDSGLLSGPDLEVRCSFTLLQDVRGDILLRCSHIGAEAAHRLMWGELDLSALRFEGVTKDGFRVTATPYILIDGCLSSDRSSYTIFHCSRAEVEASVETEPRRVEFQVANLVFLTADGSLVLHERSLRRQPGMKVDLRGLPVSLDPVPQYAEVIEEMKVTRGIAVTAKASMPIHAVGAPSIAAAEDTMDTLCWLLTLARGTQIAWM